jgi:threonine dehydrogenase-like Zn-dependent dehydrogenase
MCRNGQYRERGIKEMDGFCRETYRSNEDFLVKVSPHLGIAGVLVEPASILAKAWEQIEYIGARATWRPERCLITGAGAIGLLAAMMARQHNLHVDVLDLVTEGPKPQLVRDIGANYHVSGVSELAKTADIVIECTGVGRLVFDILTETPPGAITCLTGISSGGRTIPADISSLNKTMVLENDVVFGSVNANRRHYQKAAAALEAADVTWLRRIINRSVPLADWREATCRQPDDVKTIVQLAAV